MKNKEIEELLNKFKEIIVNPKTTSMSGKVFNRDYNLNQNEINLLLSYIEQLEKENKELKDIADEPIQIPSFLFDMTQELKIDELEKELQTTANKCKQLENNRDKAIEVITNLKPLTEEETGIKEMLKLAYSADNIKNLETSFKTICHLEDFEIAIWNIKDILKGDSDE